MPAVKRSASAAPALSEKCRKVVEGFSTADLPPQVKQLVTSVLDFSVAVPKDERHAYQAQVVDALASVLVDVEGGMVKGAEAWEAKVDSSNQDTAAREAAMQSAEAQLGERRDTTREKKYALADAAEAFKTARQAVDLAKATAAKATRELSMVAAKEEKLASALQDTIKPLTEAGAEAAGKDVASLLNVLGGYDFDESILTALPGAITKKPEERGPFDVTVVTQLGEEVAKRLGSLRATSAAGEQTKAEHAAEVEAAEAALWEARERQQASADTFTCARQGEESAGEALEEAKAGTADAKKAVKAARQGLTKVQEKLGKFREGPLLSFAELRDYSVPTEEGAPPEEAAELGA